MTDKIEVEKPARYHAIERTSPKGPGHKYVGTCWQCGKTGLTLADAQEPCENIAALTETESLLMAIEANPGAKAPWPDPTPEMLNDPIFEAIWQTIKRWDINVPTQYVGYCGATGNHVRAIFDAVLSTTALSELDRLRSGIKRLSDEEELCAETTGDDPFSLVYLAAKLANAEAELRRLRSSNEAMRKALEEIAGTEPSGHLDFHKPKHTGYSALEIARAALSLQEEEAR